MLPVPTYKHPEHVMGAPGMNGRGSPALVGLNKLSLLNCAQALSAQWKGTKPSHTDSFPPLRPETQLCRVLCVKKTERCRQPCRADHEFLPDGASAALDRRCIPEKEKWKQACP